MNSQITQKDLESVVARINRMTGNAEAPYSKKDGKLKANIGNYHLDFAYSGVKLVQMMNEGGGIRVISNGGYGTKRELYNEMHSFIRGLELAKESI